MTDGDPGGGMKGPAAGKGRTEEPTGRKDEPWTRSGLNGERRDLANGNPRAARQQRRRDSGPNSFSVGERHAGSRSPARVGSRSARFVSTVHPSGTSVPPLTLSRQQHPSFPRRWVVGSSGRPLCRRGPNHALQRTEAGEGAFPVFRALLRQPLSLSLDSLGT